MELVTKKTAVVIKSAGARASIEWRKDITRADQLLDAALERAYAEHRERYEAAYHKSREIAAPEGEPAADAAVSA